MPDDIAQRFMELFDGMRSAHGTHGIPIQEPGSNKWSLKSSAQTLREPVTLELWQQHLAGARPLGIIPINEESECVWGSIDVDIYDQSPLKWVEAVTQRKLPLIPCRSKSGGLHLFLFLQSPVPAASLLACLRNIAASLGLAGSEIFPKQAQVLVERGDFGSWMLMPYYGDTFDGKIEEQVGLRPTGAELTAEEFLRAAEAAKLSPDDFEKLVDTAPPLKEDGTATKANKKKDFRFLNNGGVFSDGPPCLQHMAQQGIAPGGQNSTLMMMGIYFKRSNPNGWETELEKANAQLLQPPGSSQGLQSVIRSLKKKDYNYTCKTEPMRSHCNSAVCRTRRWGVGEEGNYPKISGLSKLDTDPAIWFVDVGDQRIELTTNELQMYNKFHSACMEYLNLCYRPMKQDDWLQVVASAMENVTLIPASADISVQEQFREKLEEFLTNRQRGNSQEDLLNGRPWEDEEEGRYYFRLQDLMDFLARKGDRDAREAKRGTMVRRLEKLGGSHKGVNVKGKYLNLWWVPVEAVQATPEVDPPPVPGVVV